MEKPLAHSSLCVFILKTTVARQMSDAQKLHLIVCGYVWNTVPFEPTNLVRICFHFILRTQNTQHNHRGRDRLRAKKPAIY